MADCRNKSCDWEVNATKRRIGRLAKNRIDTIRQDLEEIDIVIFIH